MIFNGSELSELNPNVYRNRIIRFPYHLAWNDASDPVIVDEVTFSDDDHSWHTMRFGTSAKYSHCAELPTLRKHLSALGKETNGRPTQQQMHDAIAGRWFMRQNLIYRIDQVRHIDYSDRTGCYPSDMSAIGFAFVVDPERMSITLNETGERSYQPHCLFIGLHDTPRKLGVMSRDDFEVPEEFAREYMHRQFMHAMDTLVSTHLPVFQWSN